MANAAEVIDQAKARAEETWVFDHPSGGFSVVLAHPGQDFNRDPKALRDNFGIAAEHLSLIRKASDSEHRPLTLEERAGVDVDARIAELEEELERLKASKAEKPRGRGRDGVESSPAKE